MDTRDSVIIGGGPAGSTCAWRLKKAGYKVALLDKAVFPREKVCAGWITPSVIDSLELDIEDYRRDRVFQTITGFQISLMSGSLLDIQYPEAVSYGIRRCEFDDYLLRRSGAELHLGEALLSLRREGDFWILNEKMKTPLLIGAGGHLCPVARHLDGERRSDERIVAAQEAEFLIDPDRQDEYKIQPHLAQLYFCDDLKGYGWCFRKGRYLNIGLGREDRSHLSHHLADFVRELKRRGVIPSDTEFAFKGHAYLLYSHARRPLIDDGLLLIGDAAGLAYTESGEGIRPSIESALLAAETVLGAGGRYDRKALAPYEEKMINRFGARAKAGEPEIVPARLKAFIARSLMSSRWFVRKVVLDRWFLRQKQLPLVFKTVFPA